MIHSTPYRSIRALFSNGETIPACDTIPVGSTSYQLRENGRDDISNQNRQATGGLGGS